MPKPAWIVIPNSTEKDQWGMENVEFSALRGMHPTVRMSQYISMW